MIGKKPIHLLEEDDRKKPAEIKHMHIDIGADRSRGGRGARQRRRSGRARRRAALAPQRQARLPIARQPPRLLRRARGRAADRRGRGARGRRRRRSPSRRRRSASSARATTTAFSTRSRRRDRRRRHPCHRRSGHRQEGERRPRARLRRGDRPRLDARAARLSSCSARRPRPRGSTTRFEASGRYTGTDADAFQVSRGGHRRPASSRSRCATCTPPVEMVQLSDVEACIELIVAFIRSLGGDEDFRR